MPPLVHEVTGPAAVITAIAWLVWLTACGLQRVLPLVSGRAAKRAAQLERARAKRKSR
jgi:hypothetical protein